MRSGIMSNIVTCDLFVDMCLLRELFTILSNVYLGFSYQCITES